jgi:ribonuclease Z
MARQILGNSQVGLFEANALRALVCGSASPLADPDRASACIAVFAGGRFYVVDTGLAVWENFALWRIPGDRVGAIFFTHFHSDHIADLGEFNLQTWAAGRQGPLRVFGPRGVERLVAGFSEAYALDSEYRTAHHGTEVMNPARGRMEAIPFDVVAGESAGTVVLEENGLVVRAFLVDHAPIKPAVGYRFDYQGRSVVVSGDTVRAESLVTASKGADVLFHEAQANFLVAILSEEAAAAGTTQYARILADIPSYHTSPVDAATIANDAGVKLLVLYHLTPPPPNRIVDLIFMRGVSDVRHEGVVLSRDGLLVTLPGGSDEIEIGRVD